MKFKLRFQRRFSVFITIFACASSILMLVKRFGFPEEEVGQILGICFGFLVVIILLAAPIAFFSRWFADRSERLDVEAQQDKGEQ